MVLTGVGVVCVYVPCYKMVHNILWKSGSKRDISQHFFLVAAVGNLKIDLTKSGPTPTDIPIPAFDDHVDLRPLLAIKVDDVRRVSRHLRCQDLDFAARHQHDLAQPLVFGHKMYAEDVDSERGGLGMWLQVLGGAYIFFRPAKTVDPYTVPELRQHAADFVAAVSNGSFPILWSKFLAGINTTDATPDDDMVDYDTLPSPPAPTLPPQSLIMRKATYAASKGEYGVAWRANQPSPAGDPRNPAVLRALFGFNNQTVRDPLLPCDVADEPNVTAIQYKPKLVDKVINSLHDLRASSTLPEDNRITKLVANNGGLPHITKWINAVSTDRSHPIARDILAGAVHSGMLQKLDPVTGEFKGWRPLGIRSKWGGLV